MSRLGTVVACVALGLLAARPTSAQRADPSFEAGAHAAWATASEFEGIDHGIGGRFAWYPTAAIGLEGEMTFYPAEYPAGVPISRARREMLGGVTLGPVVGRIRPFGLVRAGSLQFERAPRPLACILIYPPPIACVMATGQTLPAVEFGGGLRASVTRHAFIRLDASARLLRFPAPAFDSNRVARSEPFVRAGVRVTTSAGWRF